MSSQSRPFARVHRLAHLLLAALPAFAGISAYAASGSAYIRVNQVGYVNNAAKRAYLMSTAAETGATFAVKNSGGSTLYSAAIGANLGKWGNFTYVYAIDFDSLSTIGTYTISVASPVAATSPSFKIDTGANLYATPLTNSLFYYETSRDGPNYIPNSLRTAPGHLNDQSATVYLTPKFSKNDSAGALTSTGAVVEDAPHSFPLIPGKWVGRFLWAELVQPKVDGLQRASAPKVITSSSQAYAPEKILQAIIRAISVKNGIGGEVSHPNGMILIGGLQPFERFVFLI